MVGAVGRPTGPVEAAWDKELTVAIAERITNQYGLLIYRRIDEQQ